MYPPMRRSEAKEGNKIDKVLQQGKVDVALKHVTKLYKKNPHSCYYAIRLGELLSASGYVDKAISHYKAALTNIPLDACLMLSYARTLGVAGKREAAEDVLGDILSLDKCPAEMCLGVFELALSLGRPAFIQTIVARMLDSCPDCIECREAIAAYFFRQGRYADAKSHYKYVVNHGNEQYAMVFNLALACHHLIELDEAEYYYKRSITINHESLPSYTNLCAVLLLTGKGEEAQQYAELALSECSDSVDAMINLANVYKETRQYDAAVEQCLAVLEHAPDHELAHIYLYELYLGMECYEDGWREYEYRLSRSEVVPRNFGFPRWDGQPLKDKGILVFAEQGVGDEVIFSSCIPDLLQMGAKVVLDCDPRLAPVFLRSFPDVIVHGGKKEAPSSWVRNYPFIDFEIPIGSLPAYLRQHSAAFSDASPYLRANAGLVDNWADRLSGLAGLKVGLSWVAGRDVNARYKRSISLEKMLPVLQVPGCSFINIQYGDHSKEVFEVCQQETVAISDFEQVDPLSELEEFFALLASLDLVITVDNSTAHMASALGVETWVLLPYSPEWRWAYSGDKSCWYGSAKLFRQEKLGQWDGVIDNVSKNLLSMVNQCGS